MTQTNVELNNNKSLMENVTDIVVAHLKTSPVSTEDLPNLIKKTHEMIFSLTSPSLPMKEPAISIKKSVTNEYIICLEDGAKLKMLKRHLASKYNMTLDEYKRRWNLPNDYPTTAPNYAIKRSELAKKIRLGVAGRKKLEEIARQKTLTLPVRTLKDDLRQPIDIQLEKEAQAASPKSSVWGYPRIYNDIAKKVSNTVHNVINS